MVTNAWTEMLTGRLYGYITMALEENEYFDFMTVFKRVLTNKVLMDFNLIVVKSYIPVRDETLSQEAFNRKIMRGTYRKVIQAFEDLPTSVTLAELKNSSYVLRDKPYYTYMEAFWITLAWDAFGDDHPVPAEFLQQQVFGQSLELQLKDKSLLKVPSFALLGRTAPVEEHEQEPSGINMIELMLAKMERRMLAVKAKSIFGKLPKQEAADEILLQ